MSWYSEWIRKPASRAMDAGISIGLGALAGAFADAFVAWIIPFGLGTYAAYGLGGVVAAGLYMRARTNLTKDPSKVYTGQ